ncbi:MAG: hypothetical protein ACTHLE_18695 [Agriterribacter sp.]
MMKKNTILTIVVLGLFTHSAFGQIYEDPDNGNVGIGTTTIDNLQRWNKVMQLHGPNNAKLLVTDGGGIKVGMFAHNGNAAKVGTESQHDLTFTAGYWNDVMTLKTNGNVGIGTNTPYKKLTVLGDVKWGGASSDYIYSGHDAGGLYIEQVSSNANNSSIRLQSSRSGDQKNYSQFFIDPYRGFIFRSIGIGNSNVGIDIENPTEKLSVNGKIRAKEIKVEAANWPDYVFDDDYKITSLNNLERYIKANKHLPDMPSAKEIENNGLELGEMVKQQQKKIEELTLYIIEQNKRIEKLEQNKR